MPIKAGEVAFVKTTEEPVFILKTWAHPELGQDYADVRRPVAGQDGIRHVEDTFRVEELESELEHAQRRVQRDRLIRDQLFGAEDPATGHLELFPPKEN